jgi:hypothetical protein
MKLFRHEKEAKDGDDRILLTGHPLHLVPGGVCGSENKNRKKTSMCTLI